MSCDQDLLQLKDRNDRKSNKRPHVMLTSANNIIFTHIFINNKGQASWQLPCWKQSLYFRLSDFYFRQGGHELPPVVHLSTLVMILCYILPGQDNFLWKGKKNMSKACKKYEKTMQGNFSESQIRARRYTLHEGDAWFSVGIRRKNN